MSSKTISELLMLVSDTYPEIPDIGIPGEIITHDDPVHLYDLMESLLLSINATSVEFIAVTAVLPNPDMDNPVPKALHDDPLNVYVWRTSRTPSTSAISLELSAVIEM